MMNLTMIHMAKQDSFMMGLEDGLHELNNTLTQAVNLVTELQQAVMTISDISSTLSMIQDAVGQAVAAVNQFKEYIRIISSR